MSRTAPLPPWMSETTLRRIIADNEAELALLGPVTDEGEFGAGYVYDPERDSDEGVDRQIAAAAAERRAKR